MENGDQKEYNHSVMEDFPVLTTDISSIGRYGAAVLSLTAEQFYGAGYASGDLVRAEMPGLSLVVPAGTSYTDVDSGQAVLLKIEFEDRMLLAVSNENGFAEKNRLRPGDPVTIRMERKEGYRKEYQLRCLTMGESREDYPSDEAFCNFRPVRAGKIKENYLYRGFSPINPTENRADQTDRLLSGTGVKTVINLDGEGSAERTAYPGYEHRYYASLNIFPVKMNFSVRDPGFADCIRRVAEILTGEEGPFYIHCRYGRDRTGLICLILEALCGAEFHEIVLDYMLSFENIHGLERYSEKWNCQAEKRVFRCFEDLTGVCPGKDMSGEELKALMEKSLMETCGFTRGMLDALEDKLCTHC